jgi:ABC-type transport system involved in multi-copper enzyme maturation permease subunit
VSQTIAIFADAYRSINSQKLFWVGLVISGLVVAVFACVAVNPQGIKLLFWQIDSPWFNSTTTPPALFYKQLFVSVGINTWLAWLAVILALVSTAGIFPGLIDGGTIDLFVSKPIGRLRLFLTEYLAGLLFVTLQVTIFSVASLLVIGLRGGVWEPGLLVAVPLVVCFFSYLFCVCVLLGLLTRSTVAALLLTLLFWFAVFMIDLGEQRFRTLEASGVDFKIAAHRTASHPDAAAVSGGRAAKSKSAAASGSSESGSPATFLRVLHAVNMVLPKTRETVALLQSCLIRLADLPPQSANPEEQTVRAFEMKLHDALQRRSPFWILGTSLGFEFVVLAYATWVFCRRDF